MKPVDAALRVVGTNADDRAAARFTLHLDVEGHAESGATKARIYNMSQTGLRLETTANLSVGDTISVQLPEAGATDAVVVWSDHQFFGCEFGQALSCGAVSAALLKGRHQSLPPAEYPVWNANRISDDEEQSATAFIALTVSVIIALAALGIFVAALAGV